MTEPIRDQDTGSSHTPDAVDGVADWLMQQALLETDSENLFSGCCDRLAAAGVPLSRVHITFGTLHPLYASMSMTWRRDQPLETATHQHLGAGEDWPEAFLRSPLYHLIQTRETQLRRRLTGAGAVLDFPVLQELRDVGTTDYLAFVISFGGGDMDGIAGSWCSDHADGFSKQNLLSLARVQQHLGVAGKLRIRDQIARNVVATYLGRDAGLRVLNGQIRRGDGELLRAVVWYSDLRGSTRMSEDLDSETYIKVLNGYFETVGAGVLSEGGEILGFIGDAVLAMFPLGDEAASLACEKALTASQEALRRLAVLNAVRRDAGEPELAFGLGLHLGEVRFGNVGLPERLSFSVIGTTVNLVARLEALTKELGRTVLVSEGFAKELKYAWEDLGEHRLRGIESPVTVLAPRFS